MTLQKTFGIIVLHLVLLLNCSSGPPKVLYVNSYHDGYEHSDQIMEGIQETLHPRGIIVKTIMLNSKRVTDESTIQAEVQEILTVIEDFKPDLVIASDDNAVKYLLVPHLRDTAIPCVFCGVNWSCDEYELPTKNITGMVEIQPVEESLNIIKRHYPQAKTMVILSDSTVMAGNEQAFLVPLFERTGLTTIYKTVSRFDQWKEAFVEANQSADIIYLHSQTAIPGWDAVEARSFVRQTIEKPVFTCDSQVTGMAVLTLSIVSREMGVWSANQALEILNGKSPADIPVATNQDAKVQINPVLAEKIGFSPDQQLQNMILQ